MVLLDNDGFLTELTKMYTRTKIKGSVVVQFKRYIPDEKPNKKQKTETTKTEKTPDALCLIRAYDDKKKISTHVNTQDLIRFQSSFNTVLKANMDSLKKKQKKKTTKKAKV